MAMLIDTRDGPAPGHDDLAARWRNGTALIVQCCGIAPPERMQQRLAALLAEDVDWTRLVNLAGQQKVLPSVYLALRDQPAGLIPKAVLSGLCASYEAVVQRNLRLAQELMDLLESFAAIGVRVLPFKGPVLAVSCYRNLGARVFGDLDLLVEPDAVPRSAAMLGHIGYRVIHAHGMSESTQRHFHHNQQFVRPGFAVELHWRFAPRHFCSTCRFDRLWQSAGRVDLAGVPVPSLAFEDLLVALCVHGAKDCWRRLSWICDIARLLEQGPGLDWDRVLHDAGGTGARRMVFLGVQLARDLLQAPLPKDVGTIIDSDAGVGPLVSEVSSRLLVEADRPWSLDESIRLHLRARERVRDRFGYCRRQAHLLRGADRSLLPWALRCILRPCIAFTPNARDHAWIRLPKWLWGLYPLLRPIRLLISRSLRGLAAHPPAMR